MMGKFSARKLVRSGEVTYGDLLRTLDSAKDLSGQSSVNPNLTKIWVHGLFLRLVDKRDPTEKIGRGYGDQIGAVNILREFGPIPENVAEV